MLTEVVTISFSIDCGASKSKATKAKSDILDKWLEEIGIDSEDNRDSGIVVVRDSFGRTRYRIYSCPIEYLYELASRMQQSKRKWTLYFDVGN